MKFFAIVVPRVVLTSVINAFRCPLCAITVSFRSSIYVLISFLVFFFPPISAILGNLSTQNNLLIVLCREQGDDMCAAQFSSHFTCVQTQTEPLSTPPAAKFLWLRLIIFLPPSPVFFFPLSPLQLPHPIAPSRLLWRSRGLTWRTQLRHEVS